MSENDNDGPLCPSVCWMDAYGRDAECSRRKGHDGKHEDHVEGWEW